MADTGISRGGGGGVVSENIWMFSPTAPILRRTGTNKQYFFAKGGGLPHVVATCIVKCVVIVSHGI